MLTVVLSVMAAFCNAASAVLARLANVAAPEGQRSGWRLGWFLVRQPVWLVGQAFGVAVFVLTGVALYFGALAVVQPLLVLELIFVLALRRFRLREAIPVKSWYAASAICLGLGGFLAVADINGGTRRPHAIEWITVVLVWGAVAGLFILAGRRGSPARRAACLAVAAGVVWSVDASFVKQATDTLQLYGFFGLFVHWPIYALLFSSSSGIVLTQAAFQVGPLWASQPAMLIADPLASIILGVQIFGEHFRSSTPAIIGQALALTAMCLGVVFMSRWAPPTMEPVSEDVLRILRYGHRATTQPPNDRLHRARPR